MSDSLYRLLKPVSPVESDLRAIESFEYSGNIDPGTLRAPAAPFHRDATVGRVGTARASTRGCGWLPAVQPSWSTPYEQDSGAIVAQVIQPCKMSLVGGLPKRYKDRNVTPTTITYDDFASGFTWPEAVAALREGHKLPRAEIGDTFLGPAEGTLLRRGAYIPGLGYGLNPVPVYGQNPQNGLPTVQGAMLVFDPENGQLCAIVESKLITGKWVKEGTHVDLIGALNASTSNIPWSIKWLRPLSHTVATEGFWGGHTGCGLVHEVMALIGHPQSGRRVVASLARLI